MSLPAVVGVHGEGEQVAVDAGITIGIRCRGGRRHADHDLGVPGAFDRDEHPVPWRGRADRSLAPLRGERVHVEVVEHGHRELAVGPPGSELGPGGPFGVGGPGWSHAHVCHVDDPAAHPASLPDRLALTFGT